jgi:hypothetical protein
VRLSGEFGSFTGRVAHWGPDSLAGFSADPVRGGTAPVATVAWPDVERVDRQVDNTWRGAILGGLIGGLLVTPFAISATAPTKRLTSYDSNEQADAGPIVAAATVGALAAAFLGAAIGSAANRWKPVYTRP